MPWAARRELFRTGSAGMRHWKEAKMVRIGCLHTRKVSMNMFHMIWEQRGEHIPMNWELSQSGHSTCNSSFPLRLFQIGIILQHLLPTFFKSLLEHRSLPFFLKYRPEGIYHLCQHFQTIKHVCKYPFACPVNDPSGFNCGCAYSSSSSPNKV